MDEISSNPSSDFLENEKFDFDLTFSPNIKQDQLNRTEEADDEEEVFFGPVGFTEQCVATRAKTLQEENNIKPLSPLTGEQVVEIFKEATKVVLRLEKLSSTQSPISSSRSSKSSLSSSILKLSSTDSESPSWLTGKLSSGSSDGASLAGFESDKENIQPLLGQVGNFSINKSQQPATDDENKHISLAYENDKTVSAISDKGKIISIADYKIEDNGHFDEENFSLNKNGKESSVILGEHKISDDNKKRNAAQDRDENIQGLTTEKRLNVVKNEENIPTRLEHIKSFAQEDKQVDSNKVLSAKVVDEKVDGTKEMNKTNTKIPAIRAKGSGLLKPGFRNSRLPKSKNAQKSLSAFSSPIRTTGSSKKREAAMKSDNAVEKSETNKSSSSKLQKSVPAKLPQDASKVAPRSSKTLAKRKIFDSSESLDKLGEKDCKSKTKLPVAEQSKLPGPRPRRRRSISLSSLDSSQSSASSPTSQDDNTTSKLIRPTTKIPTTKTKLASSFGQVRRSKLQDTIAEKKVQSLRALPRPGFTSSAKNSKTDTKAAKAMPPPPPPEQEMKNDKIPMAATPKSSSSLPVARRRSSFKSSLSSTSSREGSPPKYFTPGRQAGRIAEPRAASSACKRRSSKPTPNRNAPSSASRRSLRSSGDDSVSFSLSPPSKPETTRRTNRKLIPDSDPPPAVVTCLSTQTVDDLLDYDDPILDVIPIQPKPIPQADLIDLSDL